MKRLALSLLVASSVCAQTISPVIVEYGHGKADGQFTVTNNSLVSSAVTIEPKSFSIVPNSIPIYRPLDSTVHLALSESSAFVGARQTHTFYYSIKCDVLPCLVVLDAGVTTGQKTQEGLIIRALVPHVVYICEKQKGCRQSVRKASGSKP
jgi:hypothetical protein